MRLAVVEWPIFIGMAGDIGPASRVGLDQDNRDGGEHYRSLG